MKIPTLSADLIDALRSRFFAKDRSIYLAANCLAYLSNGAYLSNAFISETVLSASATGVTFSNIPQGFRTLLLTCDIRTDAALELDTITLRFNGDSGANYDTQTLFGSAATTGAGATRATALNSTLLSEAANSRAKTFSPNIVFIPNYANSSAEKRAIAFNLFYGNLSADADLLAGMRTVGWRNTNVITTLVIVPDNGPNFVSGSRFQLYGIL